MPSDHDVSSQDRKERESDANYTVTAPRHVWQMLQGIVRDYGDRGLNDAGFIARDWFTGLGFDWQQRHHIHPESRNRAP